MTSYNEEIQSGLVYQDIRNFAKVKEMVTENHHLSLRDIAAELSVSHESIRTILNDFLGMKRVAARLFPKDLTHHLIRLSL